jgi:hypothetical protein
LGIAPIEIEENVSVAIHHVPDSNHAIHREWQLKATSNFSEFHGDDLQGFRGGTVTAV